jgi:chorismate mutase
MTKAVRGAIQVVENSRQAIEEASVRLTQEILRANAIAENHIVSIIYSLTEDLTAANPAGGLRRVGFAGTALFCTQEPRVEGGLPRVLRALVTYDALDGHQTVPVYLDGAQVLRPDLGGSNG